MLRHDGLSARQVRAAVDAADDIDLVRALIEPDDYNGWPPPMSEEAFYCPACQSQYRDWVLHGPRAKFGSDLTWSCGWCGTAGTRWGLVREVLENPVALQRFLSHLPDAA